jgi:hypothetical protein
LSNKGFTLLETVIFIVLAALVIPVFYLTTTSVIKDMMTPTSWIKARFVAERKMEELLAYSFGDSTLDVRSLAYTVPSCYTDNTDYKDYACKLDINYLDCNNSVNHCVGYVQSPPVLITVPNSPPPTYATNYKQISVTVTGPQGITYQAVSAVSKRQ